MVAWDPGWAASFERVRAELEPTLGAVLLRPIEHIGSTAVPGLSAKPIVDMLAVVGDVDEVDGLVRSLNQIGWLWAPEASDDQQCRRSFCRPSIEKRTHHLHVVEGGTPAWPGWIAFRDLLRSRGDLAQQYAELKTGLAERFGSEPDQRDAYRAGKADFIGRWTAEALSEDPTFPGV